MDLLNTVKQLTQNSQIPSKEIAAGAGVQLRWYHFFLAGKYDDPGVKKIQKLYDFLTNQDAVNDSELVVENKPISEKGE